ncbi:MAG: hypothetical protein V2A78_04750 [bacterium]
MRKVKAKFVFVSLFVTVLLGGGLFFLLRGIAEYRVSILFGNFIPLQSLLERQVKDVILYDLSRSAFQRREEGKLETAMWSGRVTATDLQKVRSFVRQQVECDEMSGMCLEELRQLEVLQRELGKARDLAAQMDARLRNFKSKFYREGRRDTGELLSGLQFFIEAMKKALESNLLYIERLGLPSSRKTCFERDKYFASASSYFVLYRKKSHFYSSFIDSRREGVMEALLNRYMETASQEYRKKAAANSLAMIQENRKVVYHLSGDVNGDGEEEVVVVTSLPSQGGKFQWLISIYEWNGEAFAGTYEKPLGLFREGLDVQPHQDGLSRNFWRGLHLRFNSLVPEIVIIFQESSGKWTHFTWDGKKYVKLQRYDAD